MEAWELLIDGYTVKSNIREFTKIIETAKHLLNEDLADFEIDWILECLFLEPVRMLVMLKDNRSQDSWSKITCDCFILIGEVVYKQTAHVKPYAELLVQACTYGYFPHVRKQAMQCLIKVVRSGIICDLPVSDLMRILSNPEESLSCRVPLAELLGTICEHRPELVGDVYIDIWTNYLSIMESNKNTETLTNGVLLGVYGLLKHFGVDLPVVQLNGLYEEVSRKYILQKRCELSSIKLLCDHCSLFPEKMIPDSNLRHHLWRSLERSKDDGVARAIDNVYDVLAQRLESGELNNILTTEVYPKLTNSITKIRKTALDVLWGALTRCPDTIDADTRSMFLKHVAKCSTRLVFELQRKLETHVVSETFEYDHVLVDALEQASSIARNGHTDSPQLMRLLIQLYGRCPKVYRKKYVAHTILAAETQLRTGAITFLMNECCQPPADAELPKTWNITRNLTLWKDLFDSANGKDSLVLEKSRVVFAEFIEQVCFVLESFLEKNLLDAESSKERLSLLLELAAKVMHMENVRQCMEPYILYLLEKTLDAYELYGINEGTVAFVAVLTEMSHETCGSESVSLPNDMVAALENFYQDLRIDKCTDEALLCASCLALMRAPAQLLKDTSSVVYGMQILLSRDDVEADIKIKALHKLEKLLQSVRTDGLEAQLGDIISSIEKLSKRIALNGRHERLLHRDVLLFLGKYGIHENPHVYNDIAINNLKDCLYLTITDLNETSNSKINLQRILDLAIRHEDPKSLHALLLIFCANVDSLKSVPNVEEVVVTIVHRLCRCWCRGDGCGRVQELELAVQLYDPVAIVQRLVQHVKRERWASPRRMLAAITGAAAARAHSLRALCDAVCALMTGDVRIPTEPPAAYLIDTVVSALRDNNALSKEYLPEILIKLLRANEKVFYDAYDTVASYFMEIIAIFDHKFLMQICHETIKNAVHIPYREKVYPMVLEKSMNLIRNIFDASTVESFSSFEMLKEDFALLESPEKINFAKILAVLAKLNVIFEFDAEKREKIVCYEDFFIMNHCVNVVGACTQCDNAQSYFLIESTYDFLKQYADALLKYMYKATVDFLSLLISTTGDNVKKFHRKIESCLFKFQSIHQSPDITSGVHKCVTTLNVNSITELLNKNDITVIAKSVNCLKLMLNTIKNDTLAESITAALKTWPATMMRLHERDGHFGCVDRFKMATLADAFAIGARCVDRSDIVGLIVECQSLKSFSRSYIAALAPTLLDCQSEDFVRLRPCLTVLLYDLLRHCSKIKCGDGVHASIVAIMDMQWPTIQSSASPSPIEIVQEFRNLGVHPLSLSSAPGRWLIQHMTDVKVDLTERIKYLEILPVFQCSDDHCDLNLGAAIQLYESCLPSRLSELAVRGEPRLFTVMLETLAVTGNHMLLEVVMRLAIAEETADWWDSAIEQCMSSLSNYLRRKERDGDLTMAVLIFGAIQKCHTLNTKLCSRMLVPLLRYSTADYNDRFFSKTIPYMLKAAKRGLLVTEDSYTYKKTLIDYENCFMLAQVMFQKVSTSSLENPESELQKELGSQRPWILVVEFCNICMNLRNRPTPAGAGVEFQRIYRSFQCANYNCLAAAISRRRPADKLYKSLFFEDVWPLLVDPDVNYVIYIDADGKSNKRRHVVSVSGDSVKNVNLTSRSTLTLTPIFLGTLSDNPAQYDFVYGNKPTEEIQLSELVLSDNALNSHVCAATLSAILRQLSTMTDEPRPYWIEKMAAVVGADDSSTNVRWFLSQIICNCKEELRQYGEHLIPPLLKVVTDTPYKREGKSYLNGLHINILKTILYWIRTDRQADNHTDVHPLAPCIGLLIDTCFLNGHLKYVLKTLIELLKDIVDLDRTKVDVTWDRLRVNFEVPDEVCLQILLVLSRSEIYIPELLEHVLGALKNSERIKSKLKEVSELFGLALTNCQSTDRDRALTDFWNFLDSIKKKDDGLFINILYYTQMSYNGCVNEKIFRTITYLSTKMAARTKDKCYSIISTYLSIARSSDEYIGSMFETIELESSGGAGPAVGVAGAGFHLLDAVSKRNVVTAAIRWADDVNVKLRRDVQELLLKASSDILSEKLSAPSNKRLKRDVPESHIIHCWLENDAYTVSLLSALSRGLMDSDPKIRERVSSGILEFLSKDDMGVRFCEVIALVILLPTRHKADRAAGVDKTSAASRLAAAAALWRHQSAGGRARVVLREQPLPASGLPQSAGPSQLLTMTSIYQGTFRTATESPSYKVKKLDPSTGINVQVPTEELLAGFMEFSQKNMEACSALFLEFLRLVLSKSGAQVRLVLARMFSQLLEVECASELTPTFVEASRWCIEECCGVEGFCNNVQRLKDATRGTEGEHISRLLYEDTMLHTERSSSCNLSAPETEDSVMEEQPSEFSIEAMTSIFGTLSNWDDLTIKQKENIQNRNLPIFWTDNDTFSDCLDSYNGAQGWVAKMRSVYRRDRANHAFRWLSDVDKWPRRHFAVSAVTEAIRLQCDTVDNIDDLKHWFCGIRPKECLAEWAVRLMCRSVIANAQLNLDNRDPDSGGMLSRKLELNWCSVANERGLSKMAEQCVKRNTVELTQSETLPWLLQKVRAMRAVGLETGNETILESALNKTERYTDQFKAQSDCLTLIQMNRITLQLGQDLGVLTPDKAEKILYDLRQDFYSMKGKVVENLPEVVTHLAGVHTEVLWYYAECLKEACDSEKLDLIIQASACASQCIKLNKMAAHDAILAVLLDRLRDIHSDELLRNAVEVVLEDLEECALNVSEVMIEEFRRLQLQAPPLTWSKCRRIRELVAEDRDHAALFRRCLQLLHNPEFTMQQCCIALLEALQKSDITTWNSAHSRLYRKLYNVSHSGAAFRLLVKYKDDLDGIRVFENTEKSHHKAEKILRKIIESVKPKSSMALDDLCPFLANYPTDVCERDMKALDRLLRLEGVSVVKFKKEIYIYNSVRQPVILRALLNNGVTRRYLVKTGEDLRLDSSCQHIQTHFNNVAPHHSVTYKVIPLGDDAGVVELIENAVTVRSLIEKKHNINDIAANRVRDSQLAQQPAAAARARHRALCARVPARALRDAIEGECVSVQEFIVKRRHFHDSLCAMTISHWILGLGDRHLENTMYCRASGRALAVDWAAAARARELPPARLTRTLRAVCWGQSLLESKLQHVLCALREHRKTLVPIINITFKWRSDYHSSAFTNKLDGIEDTLNGRILCHQLTKKSLNESDALDKDKYIGVLDAVFQDGGARPPHGVEDQISCLIRQCTDCYILGVTRKGWEPWL